MAMLKRKTKVDKEKITDNKSEEQEERQDTNSPQEEPVILNYQYQRLLQEQRKIVLMEEQNILLKGIGQNLVEVGKVLDEKLETE